MGVLNQSAQPEITGTELQIYSFQEVLNCYGGDGKQLMVWRCSSSAGKRVERPLVLRQKLRQF